MVSESSDRESAGAAKPDFEELFGEFSGYAKSLRGLYNEFRSREEELLDERDQKIRGLTSEYSGIVESELQNAEERALEYPHAKWLHRILNTYDRIRTARRGRRKFIAALSLIEIPTAVYAIGRTFFNYGQSLPPDTLKHMDIVAKGAGILGLLAFGTGVLVYSYDLNRRENELREEVGSDGFEQRKKELDLLSDYMPREFLKIRVPDDELALGEEETPSEEENGVQEKDVIEK